MALENVRDAGLLERFHATRTQLGFDSCVVVAAQYAGPSKLDASVLLPALRTVIHKHASLCVQIAEDEPGKDMRFVRLPKIDLREVVAFLDDSADDESAIEERIVAIMKVPVELGTAKPLWRVEVLAGRTVLFAYNHSIGDGQSGLAFHAALQAALGAPATSESSSPSDPVVEIPADITLAPPLEALTDVSVSLRGYASVFFDTFAPKRFTNGYTAWTGNPVVPAASLDNHVRCWTLPPAEGAALLAQCRQHKTTLTAVFHTLSVEVLSRLVADEQAKKGTSYKTLSTSVPVSMRRFTKTSPLAMCDQASSVHSYVPLMTPPLSQSITTESFPWKAAADFAARLQREAPSTREVIGTISLLFSLGISRDFFLGALGGKRPDAFEVSNLGRFPSAEQTPENAWTIGKVCFAQCDPVRGAALKLNVVGAPDGSVGFSCTWGYGAVDDELADAFVAGVKEGLLALSRA